MVSHIIFDSTLPGAVVGTRYGPALVVLSVGIACLASYSALNIAERISPSEKTASKQAWAGAWSMGIGIWAMHFIAMLALKLPLHVSYDLLTTMMSTIPAILASAIMLSAICEVPISSGCATSSTAQFPWPIFKFAWRWSIWRASERIFPFKKFACCSLHSSSVLCGTTHISKEI